MIDDLEQTSSFDNLILSDEQLNNLKDYKNQLQAIKNILSGSVAEAPTDGGGTSSGGGKTVASTLLDVGDLEPKDLDAAKYFMQGRYDIVDKSEVRLDALKEETDLWADLGDAQSTAMGQLAASWASQIKLFETANSMLQQFLNTLVQVALQQLALAAIGTFAGGGILGLIGGGVSSLFGSTQATPTNTLATASVGTPQQSVTQAPSGGSSPINIYTDLDGLTFTDKVVNPNQNVLSREATYGV